MAKAYPKEFRDDVVAVARKGQAPLSQIANPAWLAARLGAGEAPVSRWGVGFGTAGAVRWSQRVDVTSASPALASSRCRSMAR
jgi:hypothetical protein